jgi:protein phosphatase PTC1
VRKLDENSHETGALAVTRAFGDRELKKWVIAKPHIYITELEETDTHVIIACDGVSVCKALIV